jgi:GNAT superfamily N-acetyltransferase
MSPVVIVLARPHDEHDLATLLTAQFEEHAIVLDDAMLREAIRGPLRDPRLGALLLARTPADVAARAAGPAVGLAYLAYTWTLEHAGKAAWLEELYVVPDRRSAGLGTALLRAALDHARAAGCKAVDLEVEADHARAARLYAREGFHAHSRARWFKKLG